MALFTLVAGLVGCAQQLDATEDGENDTFTGKSDAFGVGEGSPEARGVLRLVNEASIDLLEGEVGLGKRPATGIVDHRHGGDTFDTLVELDHVPYVGMKVFTALLVYAKDHDYVDADDGIHPYCVTDAELARADSLVRSMNGPDWDTPSNDGLEPGGSYGVSQLIRTYTDGFVAEIRYCPGQYYCYSNGPMPVIASISDTGRVFWMRKGRYLSPLSDELFVAAEPGRNLEAIDFATGQTAWDGCPANNTYRSRLFELSNGYLAYPYSEGHDALCVFDVRGKRHPELERRDQFAHDDCLDDGAAAGPRGIRPYCVSSNAVARAQQLVVAIPASDWGVSGAVGATLSRVVRVMGGTFVVEAVVKYSWGSKEQLVLASISAAGVLKWRFRGSYVAPFTEDAFIISTGNHTPNDYSDGHLDVISYATGGYVGASVPGLTAGWPGPMVYYLSNGALAISHGGVQSRENFDVVDQHGQLASWELPAACVP